MKCANVRTDPFSINSVLKKAGISDAAIREKVCEDFIWELSETFEGELVHVDGVPYFPLLCFATSNESESPPKQITDLYIPTDLYAPHESSCDAIVQVFGNAC